VETRISRRFWPERKRRTSRVRQIAAPFATLAMTLLICFGLMEVVLRAFPGLIGVAVLDRFEPNLRAEIAGRLGLRTTENTLRITPQMRSDHGPTIYLPAPGSTFVMFADSVDLAQGAIERQPMDRNGLCNQPQKAERSEAAIFVAGDSFVFCTGVAPNDTMTPKLEALTGTSVYNIGVPGVGPDEYLEMMKRLAPIYHPRIAIMVIYEGNDLRDLAFTRRFLETGEDPRVKARQSAPAWSYAAEFIAAGAHVLLSPLWRRLVGSGARDFRYAAMVGGKKVEMNVTNRDQDEVEWAFRLQRGQTDIDLFGPPLQAFVEWARVNQITPFLAYVPTMHTAYADSVKFSDVAVGAAVQAMSTLQRQWLAALATSLDCPFIDTTDDLQKAARNNVLTHFPANVHLTPAGHEIVARRFDRELRQRSIVTTR